MRWGAVSRDKDWRWRGMGLSKVEKIDWGADSRSREKIYSSNFRDSCPKIRCFRTDDLRLFWASH
jgi:hypothetical protein